MQYISFLNSQNPPPPTPWFAANNPTPPASQLISAGPLYQPIVPGQMFTFYLTGFSDPETAPPIVGPNTYFNTQTIFSWLSAPEWWSNVQMDYR
jgi:hypothetical protein